MKSYLSVIAVIIAFAAYANTPPAITNVRASQREGTKLVDIYYDAADADNDLLKVRIEISDNDGAKYSVPAFSLTGDIGEGVSPGTNKHVVWDAGTDWDGEYSDQMRVKVFAIDAQGFPGMEWGNEVPPGGFLMGQDGGAEGSGPSRHVNIPWSYWLGKYEVTAQQYCDFLNAALNLGYVKRENTTNVLATAAMPFDYACKEGALLCSTGDSKPIRWNVNKFECTTEASKNHSANVTWNGAIAFARFYGYDLPTDAEWEKAARGPENGSAGTHLKYPWGNEISSSYANITPGTAIMPVGFYDGNQTPVGPDTINGYGLYDVIGNAPEWTLTEESDIEKYPLEESLANAINNPFAGVGLPEISNSYDSLMIYESAARIIRGLCENPICLRQPARAVSETPLIMIGYSYIGNSYATYKAPYYSSSPGNVPIGFRVVRRHEARSIATEVRLEGFDDWPIVSSYYGGVSVTNLTDMGEWVLTGNAGIAESGIDNSKCISLGNSSEARLYLPKTAKKLVAVRFKAKINEQSTGYSFLRVDLRAHLIDGSAAYSSTRIQWTGNSAVHCVTLCVPQGDAESYFINANCLAFIDDVELITLSE